MLGALSQSEPWVRWSIALIVGFPLAIIVLGEIHTWLRRARSPFVRPLANLRNYLVPAVAAWLAVEKVLGLPDSHLLTRVLTTIVGILGISSALAFFNTLFFDVAGGQGSWQARVPRLLRDLTQTVLVLIGAAIVLSMVWDADLGGLLTALGVGSIVLGLALQDTLGNVFAGIAMLIERPFNLGDWIQTGDTIGRVIEINWRAVHLETTAQELIVIPNGSIAKDKLTNFSRPTPIHRERVEIGFSYDDPPNKVKRLMESMLRDVNGVLADPPPFVVTREYQDSSILYRMVFALEDYSEMPRVRSEIMTRIWYTAQREGLTIPYPIQMEMSMDAPPAPPRESDAERTLRAIRELPSVGAVDAGALAQASGQHSMHRYARAETILEFDQPLAGLYLILAGQVSVRTRDLSGASVEIETLKAGEFFGERSLIAGEASDVSVVASADTEIALLTPQTLDRIFALAPRLAKNIGDVMERRRKSGVGARGAQRIF
jgi:small-conductance mechanosensitive channel